MSNTRQIILQTLWLDQRGTGLSSPISAEFLASLPNDPAKAKYLKNFRADSIGEPNRESVYIP